MTKLTVHLTKLQEKARSLPTKPGCYLMKSSSGKVIYVGKAKSLKSRVSSYFQLSAKSPKTEILVGHIRDFEFVLTDTEPEALILENNLIKKYRPKYNILMRDDKSYPYVSVKLNEPYPRPQYIRRVKRDAHHKVYGPFVHGSGISEVLRILMKSFQLRDCSVREFNSRKEPCLLYQIKQCSAPCVDKISKANYEQDLQLALNFFENKPQKSLDVLNQRMLEAADREEFEYAAMIRDNIEVLNRFSQFSQQGNVELLGDLRNVDVLAYYEGEIEVEISVYLIRNGLLLGHKNFHFPVVDCTDTVESEVINFMFQYYTSGGESLPEVVVVDFEKENRELFKKALNTSEKVKVMTPKTRKNDFTSLLKLTLDHAKEHQRVRKDNEESVYVGLNKLKELLGLSERPVVLECYDIAIFQGKSPTASQIVFRDGTADKKQYRYYHLKELEEGNNDFAMMKEVLDRRMDNGNLPDVFIVDGGKGQLSILQGVLKDKGLDIPVCAIAKSKARGDFQKEEVTRSDERLFIPGRANPYLLHKNKSLFRIITQMRDEAHRFSRKLHHKAEKKRTFSSWLDQVEGIGPKRKKEILQNLKVTKEELAKWSAPVIAQELGVSIQLAKNILKVIQPS